MIKDTILKLSSSSHISFLVDLNSFIRQYNTDMRYFNETLSFVLAIKRKILHVEKS